MGADGVETPIAERDVAIVVASGATLPDSARAALPGGATVVAADGGVDAALAMGLTVDVAVGDFDSVTAEGLARAEASGAKVERHPEAKDATDLELALEVALTTGAHEVLVLASGGGRLDHLLAAAGALTALPLERVHVRAWFGGSRLWVVTRRWPGELHGAAGDLVTLLPWNGAAHGVRTTGLVYPLHGEDLRAGTSRGVSNVLATPTAHVTVTGGTLLAVLPAEEELTR